MKTIDLIKKTRKDILEHYDFIFEGYNSIDAENVRARIEIYFELLIDKIKENDNK